MSTHPVEHETAASLVLKALDGPRGPEVASAIIHKWLCGGTEGVPDQQIAEIVKRWPYAKQVIDLLGQVERLSLVEHMRVMQAGADPRVMIALKGREIVLLGQIREYLSRTITDPNARASLGLGALKETSDGDQDPVRREQ